MSSDLAGTDVGQALPPAPPTPPAPYVRPPKSPGLAVLLSLFPGLGQVYNGHPAKAFVFFFSWVGCIYLAAHEPMPFGMFVPFVYLYNLVDAWRSAVAINARHAGSPAFVEEDTVESPAWGITLICVGIVLLLHNLGWLNLESVARYWPILLIAAGGVFLRGAFQKRSGSDERTF